MSAAWVGLYLASQSTLTTSHPRRSKARSTEPVPLHSTKARIFQRRTIFFSVDVVLSPLALRRLQVRLLAGDAVLHRSTLLFVLGLLRLVVFTDMMGGLAFF